MFITHDFDRSPVHSLLGNTGDTYWHAAELALNQIWFLLSLNQVDKTESEPCGFRRTLLLSDENQVKQLVQLNDPDVATVTAVCIITPGHVNGTKQWVMESLARVWSAREPDSEHPSTSIFETKSGHRYSNSFIGTPVDQLIVKTLEFECMG